MVGLLCLLAGFLLGGAQASGQRCLCEPKPFQPPGNLTDLTPSPQQYSSFPIFDEVVIQNFKFTTCVLTIVELNDAFCTGNFYQVYDNFALIESGESILNFCGISGNPLQPIVRSPVFTKVEFVLDPGTHFFTVVIFHSPIGRGRTSMRITLKPQGCCTGGGTDIDGGGIEEQCIFKTFRRDQLDRFQLTDYLEPDGSFKRNLPERKCRTCF